MMNRTVYATAIACLIVGALTGHLLTRVWTLKSSQDLYTALQEPSPPAPTFSRESTPPASKMEKVTGIGGFFFRVKNSNALNQWYEQHLGIRQVAERDEDGSWWQEAGPTVFASESATDQAGGPDYAWRINFRVRDLDAMVAQLRAAGAAVEVDDGGEAEALEGGEAAGAAAAGCAVDEVGFGGVEGFEGFLESTS